MQFLHKAGNARIIVTPEDITWFEAQGGQRVPKRLKGETIEFTVLGRPWDWGNGDVYFGSFYTEDPEIISFLLNHKTYGTRMIALQEDGRNLSEDWIFEDLEDGQVRCRLNNRVFKNRAGANSWKATSSEYKELIDAFEKKKRAESEIQFDPVGDTDPYGELD